MTRAAEKQTIAQTISVPKEKLSSLHRLSKEDVLDLLKNTHKFNLAETGNDQAQSDNKHQRAAGA